MTTTVSIHALLAECDRYLDQRRIATEQFQSTHSLRSATAFHSVFCSIFNVSIHALLAECDGPPCRFSVCRRSFNPRTPCGVRPCSGAAFRRRYSVSIHALLAECDGGLLAQQTRIDRFQSTHSLRSATTQAASLARSPKSFNPRTPCGVRQINAYGHKSILRFQSTHSLRSATIGSRRKTATDKVSIHALLAECDHSAGVK